MDTYAASSLLCAAISTGIAWLIFFWFYRDYRLDKFRQDLFALRDSLFDLACSGRIGFDHRVYGLLRSGINGTIRHAHRISVVDLLLLFWAVRTDKVGNVDLQRYQSEWDRCLAELPSGVRRDVLLIRGKLHYLYAEQVVFTSLCLQAMVIPTVLWLVLYRIKGALPRFARFLLSESRVGRLAVSLDYSASISENRDDLVAGARPA